MSKAEILRSLLIYNIVLFSVILFAGCNSSEQNKVIVALGDSNGASKTGWVVQLQEMRPDDVILNYSVSGNTVGFDNLNQERLNTLKNINHYLETASDSISEIDFVIILLGTNDSKAIFDSQLREVPLNMEKLIERITEFAGEKNSKNPNIILVSPPPYGPDSMLAEKYTGGDSRVQYLTTEYEKLAKSKGISFVNIYDILKEDFLTYSSDGVHLSKEGQMLIAGEINSEIHKIENK